MSQNFFRVLFSFTESHLRKRLLFGGICGGTIGSFMSTRELIKNDSEYHIDCNSDFIFKYGIYYPTAIVGSALISGCIGATVIGCSPLTTGSVIYGIITKKI